GHGAAKCEAEGGARVGQEPHASRRSADDIEALRVALQEDRAESDGIARRIFRRAGDLIGRRHIARRIEQYAGRQDISIDEIRRGDLVAILAGVEGRADVGERRERKYADDRKAVLKVVNELSVGADRREERARFDRVAALARIWRIESGALPFGRLE